MIHIRVQPHEIGLGILDNGNVGVYGLDKQSGTMVTIEFEPESWRRFMQQAPRVKGVGISLPGAIPTLTHVDGEGGSG